MTGLSDGLRSGGSGSGKGAVRSLAVVLFRCRAMADPRDARIADLERQLAASEARVEILRQVKALLTEMERRQHMCLPHPCSHQVR